MKKVEISRVDLAAHEIKHRTDYVAEEKPLHLYINGVLYVTILCSPMLLKELALGHLLSEGVLKSVDEISEIRLSRGRKCQVELKSGVEASKRIALSQPVFRLVSTSCGTVDSWPLSKLIDRLSPEKAPFGFKVKAETISSSVRRLNTLAETFRQTGGVHVAAIYTAKGDLVASAEDVGRHNAVDKVVGICVSTGKTDFSNWFLALSGRLTGDIVLKAARMGVPLVASLSAAVDSGVEVARRTGITLVGFVRGTRMNVFTLPNRISADDEL